MITGDFFNDGVAQLPDDLRQVLYETNLRVQAPMPIVLTSVLATLSSAMHGFVDVAPPFGGVQPASLFTLVVAESGERKTSTDRIVAQALRGYESAALDAGRAARADAQAALTTWRARERVLKDQMVHAIDRGDVAEQAHVEAALARHYGARPADPRLRRAYLGDATPTALFEALNGQGRTVTVTSSDGAALLNRANADLVTRLNLLWDGEDVLYARKSGDIDISGGRLTLSQMLQPGLLDRIMARKANLLRLSGHLARVLVTRPASLQGVRCQAGGWPSSGSLRAFHERVHALLCEADARQPYGDRVAVEFTPEAAYVLSQFADSVEQQLGFVGALADVRDAASKATSNAARIAALLHVWAGGVSNPLVGRSEIVCACNLAAYFLGEFKRLFGEKTVAEQGAEYGERLHQWLVRNGLDQPGCRVLKGQLMQYGPNSVRKRDCLALAIDYLVACGVVTNYGYAKPAYIEYVRAPLLFPIG